MSGLQSKGGPQEESLLPAYNDVQDMMCVHSKLCVMADL